MPLLLNIETLISGDIQHIYFSQKGKVFIDA